MEMGWKWDNGNGNGNGIMEREREMLMGMERKGKIVDGICFLSFTFIKRFGTGQT